MVHRPPRRLVVRAVLAVATFAVSGACVPFGPPAVPTGARPVAAPPPAVPARADTKTVCAYTYHRIDRLSAFSTLIGRDIGCAVVFNNAAPNWTAWSHPWFLTHGNPNLNWAAWARARTGRRLVVTQALIPAAAPADWRTRGARGEYDRYARTLASSLVAAGVGDSVIRLAAEANGTWNFDNVGRTRADMDAWKAYWARTVRVMRSVPGAHFTFDWTVNAGYRPLSFASYYPGDAVVDIVGVDAYDAPASSRLSPDQRWNTLAAQRLGLNEVVAFARSRAKPLSIPEWGLWAPAKQGGGDNPRFVDGIAAVVRSNPVSYEAYFESNDSGQPVVLVARSPKALAAYRRHFGAHGDAVR